MPLKTTPSDQQATAFVCFGSALVSQFYTEKNISLILSEIEIYFIYIYIEIFIMFVFVTTI